MIRPFVFIFLTSLVWLGFSDIIQAGKINRSNVCKKVGIVLISDDPAVDGVLCQDDRLLLESKILISCRYKPLTKWLDPGEYNVNQICRAERSQFIRCQLSKNCVRNRSSIVLIGSTFATRDSTPRLQWHPIEGVQEYELLIQSSSGDDLRRAIVNKPEYEFDRALVRDDVYQIEIFAIGTDVSEKFALRLPSDSEFEELDTALGLIDRSSFTEAEKVIYRDSSYMSLGLLEEAIQNLEFSPALKTSAELKYILGDRYLEFGYFKKGLAMYQQVVDSTAVNTPEYSKALEVLRLYSQLPTSTKFPQE